MAMESSSNTKLHSDGVFITPAVVTAIVPARNEEKVIAACVESLEQQSEIGEILVVNDQSTDRTADIVRGLTVEISHLRLLQTREVPPGWVGKNNAVWIAAREANSAWLLFTDADAELAPGAVRRALEIAEEQKAALVSFSPQQVTETWYEKSLIPFVYCRLAKYFSFDAVNDPASPVAAANGQFLMIRRESYEAMGGHASIAGEVLEDVALARRAMCEGWTMNLYQLLGGRPGAVYRELLGVVPWVPLLLLMLGMWLPFALLVGLGLLLARHAAYGAALASNHFRLAYILYYIPGVVLYAVVLWASYRAHVRGKVAWKGREISVGAPEGFR
jgi:hypothetical protein